MSVPTRDEILRAIELLERFEGEPTLFHGIPEDLRIALLSAAGKLTRPTRYDRQRTSKAFRVIRKKERQESDREARAATEIRAARQTDVFVPPPQLVGGEAEAAPRELKKPRACYICHAEFTRLHVFYDALCPACSVLNYEKRFQTASLVGKVALITGARVKIGFQAALKMLRAGARVIVTTRFPRDAAERYAREPDFASFGDRLEIHGLDLRHSPSVEIFARYLEATHDRLDLLINNAAQTVRRPPAFYAHLVEAESRPFGDLPGNVRPLLRGHEACKESLDGIVSASHAADGAPTGVVTWHGEGPGAGIRSPALLSQLASAYDDVTAGSLLFPAGRTDADLQQIDLRTVNSWRLALADVPTAEMLEVQLVNAVAPFILASKLKPLMMRDRTDQKHVVNVSAVEGQFSRHTKTDKHPHTNMAKAALNMMTLTSAPDYAKDGIFMNAVDTGWVTDEDPAHLSERKQQMHDFQPPLDIVDGAARICDPFFSGLITGNHVFGKFLKDYVSVPWLTSLRADDPERNGRRVGPLGERARRPEQRRQQRIGDLHPLVERRRQRRRHQHDAEPARRLGLAQHDVLGERVAQHQRCEHASRDRRGHRRDVATRMRRADVCLRRGVDQQQDATLVEHRERVLLGRPGARQSFDGPRPQPLDERSILTLVDRRLRRGERRPREGVKQIVPRPVARRQLALLEDSAVVEIVQGARLAASRARRLPHRSHHEPPRVDPESAGEPRRKHVDPGKAPEVDETLRCSSDRRQRGGSLREARVPVHLQGLPLPPQTPGTPPPPQVWGAVHTPHCRRPPQPSPAGPQSRPCCVQVFGVQLGEPQLPGLPPPPHVCPAGHDPQSSAMPQPSPAGPQLSPWAVQVVGVQPWFPQTPGLPPPPQVCPVGHEPQLSGLPQPSPAGPHDSI
jgi:NAD(P)-dependent dehydrogenase (short-subunit alcohol dehydrogenase family)